MSNKGNPPRKVDDLLHAMRWGEWARAIRIAAKWPRLGEHREAIMGAAAALLSPAFYVSLGKDPQAMIDDGIAALKARYGHMQQPQQPDQRRSDMTTQATTITGLRKYVLEAEGATKKALAELAAQLPEVRADIAACTTDAKTAAAKAKIDAMPHETPLDAAWRKQLNDMLRAQTPSARARAAERQKLAAKEGGEEPTPPKPTGPKGKKAPGKTKAKAPAAKAVAKESATAAASARRGKVKKSA